jgi:nucleotide-binding universal stress UspA family protein
MDAHLPRRILIPVDFTAQSRAAVDYAILLAERFGAEVQLLHIWRPVATPTLWDQLPLDEFVRTNAGQTMKSYLAELEESGVKALGRLEQGEPAETIVEVAREDDLDLIVMGTHGRTGLSRLLHRHVAERVIRASPCPVITLRVPEDEQLASPELVTDQTRTTAPGVTATSR